MGGVSRSRLLIGDYKHKATPTKSVVSRPPPASYLSIRIESPLLSLFSKATSTWFYVSRARPTLGRKLMIIFKITCLVVWVCTKANSINVLLAYCINKAWSKFGRVVKAEFAVDNNWLFTNNYWQFFFKRAIDEQIALLRLSKLI